MSSRTSRRARLLATVAGLAVAATTALAPAAHSAPAPQDFAACPDAYPVSDLTANQPVSVLTVSRGNTPDTYTGQVLGVLTDGIAPGLDMIMVRVDLTGQPDGVTGIWEGMSGSPVYAADGRLIGAVSYGLAAGPSSVAGVTPAADMQALLNGSEPSATARAMATTRHVALPERMQQRLVTDNLATPSAADEGLARLPLPVSVSGIVNSKRLSQAQSMLHMSDVRMYSAGAAPSDPAPEDAIFPGSNLAASMSYGDLSFVGTGTTTMVCSGQVVGFGHPFNFTGDSTMTLHGADAIYIQDDPTFSPFKVSNTTGPVGEITGDHLAGITGPLGQLPQTTLVESTVTRNDGNTRTGDTYVSLPDFVPDAAALAELSNQDRVFDRVGPGSSLVHFTVDGTTADGEPFTLARTNRFASGFDISYESIFEANDDLYSLIGNRFTGVTINSVKFTTQISTVDRVFNLAKVQRKVGTSYVTLSRSSVIAARPGKTITLRVTLTSPKFGTKVELLKVKVPYAPAGTSGALSVGRLDLRQPRATSFDNLITKLANAPRNDQVSAAIDLFSRKTGHLSSTDSVVAHDVVRGARGYEFRVLR